MTEERINELAVGLLDSMPTFIRCNREWQPILLEKFEDTIRLAIKESSEEKDEVIRLIAKDEALHGEDASKVIKCLRELRAL